MGALFKSYLTVTEWGGGLGHWGFGVLRLIFAELGSASTSGVETARVQRANKQQSLRNLLTFLFTQGDAHRPSISCRSSR